jgi:hypothetical protein
MWLKQELHKISQVMWLKQEIHKIY